MLSAFDNVPDVLVGAETASEPGQGFVAVMKVTAGERPGAHSMQHARPQQHPFRLGLAPNMKSFVLCGGARRPLIEVTCMQAALIPQPPVSSMMY